MTNRNEFSLTLTQEDIYFDQLRHFDNPLYNVGGYIRIGSVDIEKLQKAHQQLVETVDIFGVRIIHAGKDVSQYICDERDSQLPVVDFTEKSKPENAAQEWLKLLFETPFEIENKALFKGYLLKISNESYWYVGFAHHLIMDGWGFANWAKSLGLLYNGMPKEELKFSEWSEIVQKDKEYLCAKKYQADQSYWEKQPLENSSLLPPFYESEFSAQQCIPSSRKVLTLSTSKVHQLAKIGEKYKLGVSHLFLSIVTTYLAKTYSRDELTLGLPFHNRKNFIQKGMLGVFTSVSPMNISFSKDISFIELAKELATRQRANLRHQRYPIGHMIRNLNQGSDSLYDVGFNYLKLDSDLSFDNNTADLVYLSHNHEATPLMVTVWEYGAENYTEIQFDYNYAYLSDKEAEFLAARIEYLLDQVLETPETKVNKLSLIPEAECKQLFYSDKNKTENEVVYIHQFFELIAEKNNNKIAVSDLHNQLTYQQLNSQANQIAHCLSERGIGPEDRVGVCLERSVYTLVTLLGILKSGAAYVPLDHTYPQARLNFILDDSQVRCILTQQSVLNYLEHASYEKLIVDDIICSQTNNVTNFDNRKQGLTTHNLAYLIYTSGSTGRPKAVEICHSNAVGLINWAGRTFDQKALSKVLATTSINFDLSVFELFVPISFGYQCVILENPIALIDNPVQVSLINTVPSSIKMLLEQQAIPDSVKVINLAGEPLARELVNQLLSEQQCDQVYNLYGPSEDTTYSTFKCFDKPLKISPSIGKAIDETELFVISENSEIQPWGLPGELYIGGKGVARGYLNQQELTSQSFIENTFGVGQSTRLYRTGDYVRLMSNGDFQFLGRKDEQIKIRGFRVELGEVQYQILSFDKFDACAVVINHQLEQKRVVAYLVVKSTFADLSQQELKSDLALYLQQRLPDYMQPTVFLFLPTLPLTPNGKLDKKSLPLPGREAAKVNFQPAKTALQSELIKLWAKLLKLDGEEISIQSSFFELGGDSILAVRLVSEIRSELAKDIAINSVFKYPTIQLLAKQIEAPSDEFVRGKVLPLENRAIHLPPSFAQQRLWFIDQLEQGSSHYNMPIAFSVSGLFDVVKAELAIRKIIQRHETLRTVYREVNGALVQIINTGFEFNIDVVDLTKTDSSQQTSLLSEAITENHQHCFNLEKDLMLKVSYVQLKNKPTDEQGVFLFNMHHIASDGWSLKIFVNEFIHFYQADNQPDGDLIEPMSIQYSDYAYWQRSWLKDAILQKQLNFWKDQLSDLPETHSLPLKIARPATKVYQGRKFSGVISDVISEKLLNLAKEMNITPFMLLYGALDILLAFHSSNQDIVIGTPVANRLQKEVEPLIGVFVNTLILRNNSPRTSLTQHFENIRQINLEAQANQDIPFEHLVENLNILRNSSYTPLFQIMFALEEDTSKQLVLPGLTLTELDDPSAVAKFDLDIGASFSEQGLMFSWLYDETIFHYDYIKTLHQHLVTLLVKIVENPEAKITDLAILSADEEHKLMALGGCYAQTSLTDHLIHEIFEQCVEENPDRPALVCSGETISYQSLNQQANQLAHYLTQKGVSNGVLVGLCVDRSVEMIIGILAILKAGGAYVPFDSEYPEERLQYMLKDCSVKYVLAVKNTIKQLSLNQEITPLIIDEDATRERLASFSVLNCKRLTQQSSDDLAYVIYTSGSTGKPKGVMVSHKNWNSYRNSAQKIYNSEKDDRILQFSSVSFDIFIEEMSLSLLVGGCLVLPPTKLTLTSVQFWHFIQQNKISIVSVPTAYWHQLCSDVELVTLSQNTPLKLLITGGEAMSVSHLKNWQNSISSDIKLLNTYGPTETTVIAAYYDTANFQSNYQEVPIGQALSNCKLLVLNEDKKLVPLGAIGELYIGGEAVASGYLNQEVQTKRAFVNYQFTQDKLVRLYKSGDLVRYHHDGVLEYIGRSDSQVKIRGFRIEPGEIEKHILDCHLINNCVVSVSQVGQSDKRLVAYIVATESTDLSDSQLKTSLLKLLADSLPEYMIPSAIVILKSIPLTNNGKIDWKSLPIPSKNCQLRDYKAPKNELEKQIIDIWADILQMEASEISVDDNFFELGGHSLLSIRLISSVRYHFHCEIELKDFFSQPTTLNLARIIKEKSQSEQLTQHIVASQAHPDNQPTSAQQQRFWLLSQLTHNANGAYNLHQGFELNGEIDTGYLKQAFEKIVKRHQVLAANFQLKDNMIVQVFNHPFSLPFSYVDLTEFEQQQKAAKLTEQIKDSSQYQFDLADGALLKIDLIKTAEAQYILLITIHHILVDGWSVRLLIEEFREIYSSLLLSTEAELPELSIQYSDYSRWQEKQIQKGVESFQLNLNFWQNYLEDIPQCHNLPLDHARPAKQSFNGDVYTSQLNSQLSKKINQLCLSNNATLFMTLYAAFSVFLSRYSHSSDIVVGTPVANRNLHELENLIGCFINSIALRTHVEANLSFQDLLDSTKDNVLSAFEFQQFPFETLVENLPIERSASFSPVFQIMFVLHNNQEAELSLPGLKITERPTELHAAKFDLTLNAIESDDQIIFNWEYNSDIFEKDTIEKMVAIFSNVLDQLVNNPQLTVQQIKLMKPEQHLDYLSSLTTSNSSISRLTVNQLIETQCEKTPDSIAIVDGTRTISYRNLNIMANQLASSFIDRGVKVNSRVGIIQEHSINLIANLIAIMKIGACYVPFDPTTPVKRKQSIIKDANIEFMLSDQSLDPAEHSCEIINSTEIALENYPEKNLDKHVNDLQSAYIIYTSGSTGMPKGVEIGHAALTNFILSMQSRPGFSREDKLLAVTPLTFDISGLEIYLPLISGGQLVVGGAKVSKDGAELANIIESNNITVMQATPAMWRILVESGWSGKKDLKALCGGESLPVDLVDSLNSLTAELWNMYGPTETTIWSTCGKLSNDSESKETLVHIGSAIDNTHIYILDQGLNLVPEGVTGQIYIGGRGLAKGYLNREELTAKSFIDNPFYHSANTSLSQKIYATGDLGRYDQSGNLIHLGRVDHQIKLRGFRIEPGDIESALNSYELINDSLVLVYRDGHNIERLAAYYTLSGERTEPIDVARLRAHLLNHLPGYMIPSIFMMLDSFPLTSSGKKNRNALPEPVISRVKSNQPVAAPENEIESFLLENLQILVGTEHIGIDDNFFEVGTTSIDIVKLATALSEKITKKISPVDFFVNPTIKSLVATLSDSNEQSAVNHKRTKQISSAKQRLKSRIRRKAKND